MASFLSSRSRATSVGPVFHLLTQISTAVTYNMFVTLGLITSVPVSAGNIATFLRSHFSMAPRRLAALEPDCRQITNHCRLSCRFSPNSLCTANSVGHRAVRGELCWHEIGWRYTDSNRFLFGHVPEQLARLHNTFAQVKNICPCSALFGVCVYVFCSNK